MSAPQVSILIPTWNGLADLERLIPALQAQTGLAGFEILALDSGSTDGTREFLQAQGIRFESIAQAEFGHGWRAWPRAKSWCFCAKMRYPWARTSSRV